MAEPLLASVEPAVGAPGGGELVRLLGTGFGARMHVRFDGVLSEVLGIRQHAGRAIADVRSPAHAPGTVDIQLTNLDSHGAPIESERTSWPRAFRYERRSLVREADLTRAVRQLLRLLKQQVLENANIGVSIEYDDAPGDATQIALAKLPAVTLTGPTLRPNRFYTENVLREQVVAGADGPELQRSSPVATVDLAFTLTGASTRTVELLALMASITTFLHRQRWLELARDPDTPSLGTVRWELDPQGDVRIQAPGRDDLHAFTASFVVRGFDIDEGVAVARAQRVVTPELQTQAFDEDDP